MRGRRGERLEWLRKTLASGGTIHLSDAANQCGVSKMTIRRDIAGSENNLRLLAGRILMSDNPRYASIYDLSVESDSHLLAKKQITQKAATLIEADDTLFIDCGTTLVHLAAALDPEISVTVVTYALNVANVVNQLPNARLLLLGGLYHASSRSFSGDEATTTLRRTGVNKAFISAAGVHFDRGVSCFHFHEVLPKQAALDAAQQRILVADNSKLNRVRPAMFARWQDFDLFITNGTPDTGRMPAPTPPGPRIIQT